MRDEEAAWCFSWWVGAAARALFERWGLESEVLRSYQDSTEAGCSPVEALWEALFDWDLLKHTGHGLKIPTTVEEATT
jgi:hypothetical protein